MVDYYNLNILETIKSLKSSEKGLTKNEDAELRELEKQFGGG